MPISSKYEQLYRLESGGKLSGPLEISKDNPVICRINATDKTCSIGQAVAIATLRCSGLLAVIVAYNSNGQVSNKHYAASELNEGGWVTTATTQDQLPPQFQSSFQLLTAEQEADLWNLLETAAPPPPPPATTPQQPVGLTEPRYPTRQLTYKFSGTSVISTPGNHYLEIYPLNDGGEVAFGETTISQKKYGSLPKEQVHK